jgi:hypothetical protein
LQEEVKHKLLYRYPLLRNNIGLPFIKQIINRFYLPSRSKYSAFTVSVAQTIGIIGIFA